jgi:hypothetical protein
VAAIVRLKKFSLQKLLVLCLSANFLNARYIFSHTVESLKVLFWVRCFPLFSSICLKLSSLCVQMLPEFSVTSIDDVVQFQESRQTALLVRLGCRDNLKLFLLFESFLPNISEIISSCKPSKTQIPNSLRNINLDMVIFDFGCLKIWN